MARKYFFSESSPLRSNLCFFGQKWSLSRNSESAQNKPLLEHYAFLKIRIGNIPLLLMSLTLIRSPLQG